MVAPEAVKRALERPNLSIWHDEEAVIGAQRREWSKFIDEKNEFVNFNFKKVDDRVSFGDFASFTSFLSELIGDHPDADKSNPAIIGAVRSISGTNVSVQLYPSLNSTISYIYGNGYKVGQVGGFVKIPQGFVNLYGSIVQVGADAVPESMKDDTNTGLRWMTVQLVGEGAKGQPFERGISQYPMIDDEVHIVTEEDLVNIYGRDKGVEFVPVGTISGAENIPALIDINKLVTRHSCIVGSTGTGKSTTVAGLVNTLIDSTVFPLLELFLLIFMVSMVEPLKVELIYLGQYRKIVRTRNLLCHFGP